MADTQKQTTVFRSDMFPKYVQYLTGADHKIAKPCDEQEQDEVRIPWPPGDDQKETWPSYDYLLGYHDGILRAAKEFLQNLNPGDTYEVHIVTPDSKTVDKIQGGD